MLHTLARASRAYGSEGSGLESLRARMSRHLYRNPPRMLDALVAANGPKLIKSRRWRTSTNSDTTTRQSRPMDVVLDLGEVAVRRLAAHHDPVRRAGPSIDQIDPIGVDEHAWALEGVGISPKLLEVL